MAARLAADVANGANTDPDTILDLTEAGYLDANLKPTASYSLQGPRPFSFTVAIVEADGRHASKTKHFRSHRAGKVVEAGVAWANARFGEDNWKYVRHTDIPESHS